MLIEPLPWPRSPSPPSSQASHEQGDVDPWTDLKGYMEAAVLNRMPYKIPSGVSMKTGWGNASVTRKGQADWRLLKNVEVLAEFDDLVTKCTLSNPFSFPYLMAP